MKRRSIALAAGALAALGSAAALATAASTDTEAIDACRNLRHGLVRIVLAPDACKRNEAPVSWSTHGPAGAPGEKGRGGKGDTGATGAGPRERLVRGSPRWATSRARRARASTVRPATSRSARRRPT